MVLKELENNIKTFKADCVFGSTSCHGYSGPPYEPFFDREHFLGIKEF